MNIILLNTLPHVAWKDQMLFLIWVFLWFEVASGLSINWDKSELILVGMVSNMNELAAELGCRGGSLPTTYLGLLLGVAHKLMAVREGVEERLRKRLACWKRSYLSKGGRITLIRSMLSSMPIYLMCLLRMLKSVVIRLEKIQRDFLWGGGVLDKRSHLVSW